MKYCTKCGAPMNDDALFCPQCGTKVVEVFVEQKSEPINEQTVAEEPRVFEGSNEQPAVAQTQNGDSLEKKKTKERTPLYEQSLKEILPVPIALIVCSIALWIVIAVGNPTGITRIFPLLLFMLISALLSAMSMIRAVKSLTRKLYFKSVLSFVLFGLLVTCFFIDAIILFNS